MERVLTIIEVSQKQAYIFSDNKLKENIRRSEEIACVTRMEYLQEAIGQSMQIRVDDNLVYTGGGHTILEFSEKAIADKVIECLTRKVLSDFPEIELFAKTIKYDEKKTPGENVKELTKELEKKKSKRIASFHDESFGIEEVDVNSGKPILVSETRCRIDLENEPAPDGFIATTRFPDLGGSKDENNFIAVVHIDGNSMGKRVEAMSEKFAVGEWDQYKTEMRAFSEGIAEDFLSTYREMENFVAEKVRIGALSNLSLNTENGKTYMPVRRVISEGDDICFVSEGRIGVECAAVFLQKLAGKINRADHKPYSACAGVAIVHQKYPFYRTYELSEALCSNAKKFGASLGKDGTSEGISAIDWHLDYGELQDSLEDTRLDYKTKDGNSLELRPYIVSAPTDVTEREKIRQYQKFRKLMKRMTDKEEAYGRGRLKELRQVLKQGAEATENYLQFHRIKELGRDAYYGIYKDIDFKNFKIGSGTGLEKRLFIKTADGINRSLLFDVLELMDTYLPLED